MVDRKDESEEPNFEGSPMMPFDQRDAAIAHDLATPPPLKGFTLSLSFDGREVLNAGGQCEDDVRAVFCAHEMLGEVLEGIEAGNYEGSVVRVAGVVTRQGAKS